MQSLRNVLREFQRKRAQKRKTLNRIEISKEALLHNFELFQKLVPHQKIAAVLKSNAYGHGLELVGKLLDAKNPPFLMVDSLFEAERLKRSGVKSPILILGYVPHSEIRRAWKDLRFTVSDLETAKLLAKHGFKVHLKVETGMGRMGFNMNELPKILPQLKGMGLNIEGIYSHLADADNPENSKKTETQVLRFLEALKLVRDAGFDPKWRHIANSAGILKQGSSPELNMSRLGVSLYGMPPYDLRDPLSEQVKDLKPSLRFLSTLVQIKTLEKGESVSYNGTFTADRDMRIGVISAGYYEGIPRSLSQKGHVLVHQLPCPILGRVCMNYTIIDLESVAHAQIGDPVLVYSDEPDSLCAVDAQAKKAGTIHYELLVRLAESIRREVH